MLRAVADSEQWQDAPSTGTIYFSLSEQHIDTACLM